MDRGNGAKIVASTREMPRALQSNNALHVMDIPLLWAVGPKILHDVLESFFTLSFFFHAFDVFFVLPVSYLSEGFMASLVYIYLELISLKQTFRKLPKKLLMWILAGYVLWFLSLPRE